MTQLWRYAAVLCLAVTGALALIGSSAALEALFLVELLIALCLAYVDLTGGLRAIRLFDLPVLLTARVAFSFGIVPVQAILMPERLDSRLAGDYNLMIEALLLVIGGMLAFWAGSKMVHCRSSVRPRLIPITRSRHSALVVAAAVYCIGFACKVALLENHLYAFTRSQEAYFNNIAGAQWLMFGDSFATLGLLLISIEKFSDNSNQLVRWFYWAIVFSECGWGFVSGMKQFLLIVFLAVGAVATIATGKLAKKWAACAVLGLVLLYPFFNAYRSVVRGAGSIPVNSIGGAVAALRQAAGNFSDTIADGTWLESGADLTASRLDLLQYFGLILYLPNRAAEIQGEEQLWMIPVYPIIPRAIWPSKPVLDKGVRFNRALGGTGESSTAVPYLVDGYVYGGLLGVLGAMFTLGVVVQRFANGVTGVFSKRELFRYSVAFLFCFKIEDGIVDWWGLLIKTMIVVFVIEWLAYGMSAGQKTGLAVAAPALPRAASLEPAGAVYSARMI